MAADEPSAENGWRSGREITEILCLLEDSLKIEKARGSPNSNGKPFFAVDLVSVEFEEIYHGNDHRLLFPQYEAHKL